MQPFHTQCPTCGSRLRLRDERLLGQILPCPKCHGMVLIESPDTLAGAPDSQLHVGSASEVDSQTVTSEAVHVPAGAAEPAGDATPDASLDTAPPPVWESDRTRRTRQIAAVVALSLIGLLGSLAVFAIFVRQYQQSQRQLAEVGAGEVEQAQPADDGPLPADAESEDEAEPPLDPGDEPPQEQPEDAAEAGDEEAEPESGESAQGAEETPGQTPDESSSADASAAAEDAARSSAGENEPPRALAGPASSDAFDQALQAATGPLDRGADATAEEEELADDLPEGLQSMIPLLNLSAADSLSPPPVAELKPTLDLEGPQQRDESLHPEPARPVSIPRALDRRLRGVNFSEVPLTESVGIASQLSGAPIYVDLQLLDAAGIDPGVPISLTLKDTTTGELVDQLAQAVNCQVETVDDAFVAIQPAAPRIEQFLAPAFSVTDIADDPDALAAELSQWFADAQLKITANALRGELVVQGTLNVRFAVALALEATRRSLDVAPRLPERFTRRWLGATAGTEADAAFRPVELRSPDRATAIPTLLRQLAGAADSSIVIDWPSVWTHGLTPTETALPLFLSGDPFAEAERLLRPYDLKIVRCSDAIWWVTTAESFDGDLVCVDAEVPAGLTASEFLAQLRGFAASDEDVQMLVLPKSENRVVLRLPRYLARQLQQPAPAETALTQN